MKLLVALLAMTTLPGWGQTVTLVPNPASSRGRDPFGVPTADASRVFTSTQSGTEARSLKDGNTVWLRQPEQYVPAGLLQDDTRIFVVEASVYALDKEHGKTLWTYEPTGNGSLGHAAVAGGMLFFGTDRHMVYALSTQSGQPLWSRDLDPQWTQRAVVRAVTVLRDRLFVSVERALDARALQVEGWLFCLDAKTGATLWSYTTRSESPSAERAGFSTRVAFSGDVLFAGDALGNALRAISLVDGHLVWKVPGLAGFVGVPSTPVVTAGAVIFGSGDRHLRAIDAVSGKTLWDTTLPPSISHVAACGYWILAEAGSLESVSAVSGSRSKTSLVSSVHILTSDFDENEGSTSRLLLGQEETLMVDCKPPARSTQE